MTDPFILTMAVICAVVTAVAVAGALYIQWKVRRVFSAENRLRLIELEKRANPAIGLLPGGVSYHDPNDDPEYIPGVVAGPSGPEVASFADLFQAAADARRARRELREEMRRVRGFADNTSIATLPCLDCGEPRRVNEFCSCPGGEEKMRRHGEMMERGGPE